MQESIEAVAAPATVSGEFPFDVPLTRRVGKVKGDVRAASQETCLRKSPILRAGRAVERTPVVATDVCNRMGAASAMPRVSIFC